jgi:hypothetical protein
METTEREDERRAACRAAGRAVAATLLGFTLKSVSIHSACDESGTPKPKAAMALKASQATFEEKAFMDLAGTWGELDGVDCPGQSLEARTRILGSFQQLYPSIDAQKTRCGLITLMDSYGDSVRALAEELLRAKSMNGSECGRVIMANSGIRKRPM